MPSSLSLTRPAGPLHTGWDGWGGIDDLRGHWRASALVHRRRQRARVTEPRENFNHEHQNTQVVNGVQLGDLIQYVDFNYIARVTGVNAAALWALATSPSTPKNAQIHVSPPVNFAGTNLTPITWNANPESNLAGYEIVVRPTTFSDWIQAIPVGNVTSVTLNIAKDNVQFGVRAVDQEGNRSPVAFPQTVTT